MRPEEVLSVSQVTARVKGLLDQDEVLRRVYVRGEISDYKVHTSGHHYFTLKDEGAVLSAVCFKSDASKLKFRPTPGMKIIARGRISLFAKSGHYQMYVEAMIPDGVGELFVAFEQLKKRLGEEGLFDQERKKPIPRMPGCIALVTSPTGAAVRDMIRITGRRFPLSEILVCPVLVQGAEAPESIAGMVDYVNAHGLADVMIVGRGGGSFEDLWCFNDERVARAIARSAIPVVSAVGHEPDVTIADFVADLRAPTPSGAAELAVPDEAELRRILVTMQGRMTAALGARMRAGRALLKSIREKNVLSSPTAYVDERRMNLLYLGQRMGAAMERKESALKRQYVKIASLLDAMSPLKVLGRGYAIATDQDNRAVTDARRLHVDDELTVRFAKGRARCRVIETMKTSGKEKKNG